MTNRVPFNCADDPGAAIDAAVAAIAAGQLVVLPTDTVYGVGANAFQPAAVQRLLAAKGRGRQMPPPVLISRPGLIDTLAIDVPQWLRAMVAELWPGPLTVILSANPSIAWDLGDTAGTVALRVPDHEVTRQLIDRTGPLAVSSANLSGSPAATTIDEALQMLGDSVEVYLDAGPTVSAVPSTILDATTATAKVVRLGGVDLATLHRFNNTITGPTEVSSGDPQLATDKPQGADD